MARTMRYTFCLALMVALATLGLPASPPPRFFDDDPLAREPESQDASRAAEIDINLFYDLALDLFVTTRREPANVRAGNVNTIDEVPDSGWFTNRILPRLPDADLVRGPNTGAPPNPERWTIVREKSAGASPGFTAKDANGETWFVAFDAPGHPEGATAAAVIATKMFWALGYNQVETFVTTVDPRRVTIDPKATRRRPNGKRTPFRRGDLDEILERASRGPDGTYRAAAGRLLSGRVIGPFRYEGTRPDDPNDLVDHQHRRELRALRVFGAWTNLTDMKDGNTLDMVVTVNGRSLVRHYMQDVGSTFGIGANGPHDWDEGFEYLYEGGVSRRRMMTLGLALSPWQRARYEDHPSVGRFESEQFDPSTWKPRTPTRGFIEMRPEDAFWAARRVAAIDDDLIRAMVREGRLSDPAAAQYLARMLIERRNKIAKVYLPAVNPVVNPRLSESGELTFENAAITARVAEPPQGYVVRWARFDNGTGAVDPIGETRATGPVVQAPAALPRAPGGFVQVEIAAEATARPAWQRPVLAHFRRGAGGWTLVGLER